jgi:phosphatidate cytidylyltransferase
MSHELRNRIVFGLLFAALATIAVATDVSRQSHVGTATMAFIGVIIGSREYVRLARTLVPQLSLIPVLGANVLLVALPMVGLVDGPWADFANGDAAATIIGVALGCALLEQMFRRGPQEIFAHVGATMLGIAYLGIPFLLLQRMAALPTGGALVLVFIAAVKCSDVTAFFGGKTFGRHKMCPSISPGKTWEGFACSFIGAIGGSYLFAWLPTTWGAQPPFAGWWQPAVWGVILGPLGVLGDLAESCLKRAAGRKDSGTVMPGFGGMLDVLDALIIAAPAAYLLSRVL